MGQSFRLKTRKRNVFLINSFVLNVFTIFNLNTWIFFSYPWKSSFTTKNTETKLQIYKTQSFMKRKNLLLIIYMAKKWNNIFRNY